MEAPPFAGRHSQPETFTGGPSFIAGVLFPAFTIGFELTTRLCAQSLFDPLPTLGHLALVVAVPVLNFKLWTMRRSETPAGRGWLFAGAAATAVGFAYALLFLPIYPLAFLGILFYGLGLLPFAPLVSGITSLAMVRGLAKQEARPRAKLLWSGALTGLLLTLALDVPTAITRYAVRANMSPEPATRARAISLMRGLGSRELLLRFCYDHSGYSGGLLGLIIEGSYRLHTRGLFEAGTGNPPQSARELYYRVTGDPYNIVRPPWTGQGWRFAGDFNWDPDRGSAQVGGRLAGLSLASSRIDASMDADDAVAYLEWTAEFANQGQWQEREARLSLALPPGGVVSRATLWVNGEEREAVFASREKTRAAYERVVRTRRDPLLVTTNGADQVLVQMFPVPAQGRAKIRIGITAPLALSADDRAALVMPAIVDRNFSIDAGLRHAVWVEGDGREAVADAGFAPVTAQGPLVRRRAEFSDADLSGRRPRISLSRNPKADSLASGEVLQTILREPREPSGALFVLLDGSARAAPARAGLIGALAHIPKGARVGFGVASDRPALLPPEAWTAGYRAKLLEMLDDQEFEGGQDNLGALAQALVMLEGEPRATLLWVHGPQGFVFDEHEARMEQVLERASQLPQLWLLPVTAGPNKTLRDPRVFARARTLAWSGDPARDISDALTNYFDDLPHWTIRRVPGTSSGAPQGSGHVEKLWAAQEIEALASRGTLARDAAIALAAKHHLVTPVSGAVVLESDAQYLDAGLAPPDAAAVPTIPEPETWALLIIACLAFAWALRQRRRA